MGNLILPYCRAVIFVFPFMKQVVRLLLEHGASANAMASNTVRPIHLAASAYKGAAMMKTLLQYGAEVDAEISEGGGNALTIALSARRREQALLLLEAGADPLYAPSIPNAPLVAAARAGFHDVLQLMIEVRSYSLAVLSTDTEIVT